MNIGTNCGLNGKFEVETFSVVSCQIPPISAQTIDDVNKNVDQICQWMDRAVTAYPGMDMFVTSECAFQGFGPLYNEVMIDLDGPQINQLKEKCKDLEIWGVFNPMIREIDGHEGCNTAIIINDKGEIVHQYIKMNPWIPFERTYPGDEIPICEGPKGARIATIICYDGDFPETWREARSKGANVIIRVSHYGSPFEKPVSLMNRAMAWCNKCYVVTCNSVGVDEAMCWYGHSMIIGPDGNIITEAALGLPWMIKADLYPAIIDHMEKEAITWNSMWDRKNRGASHPEMAGKGKDLKSYTSMK